MKGWRTLLVNLAMAVGGVVIVFNWGDVLPAKYALLMSVVVIPAVNGWMRVITTTPVGKDTP